MPIVAIKPYIKMLTLYDCIKSGDIVEGDLRKSRAYKEDVECLKLLIGNQFGGLMARAMKVEFEDGTSHYNVAYSAIDKVNDQVPIEDHWTILACPSGDRDTKKVTKIYTTLKEINDGINKEENNVTRKELEDLAKKLEKSFAGFNAAIAVAESSMMNYQKIIDLFKANNLPIPSSAELKRLILK